MIIESSAPTRVDLAGGTIDIPPLFLFHEGACTVNFAIDLMAKCRIEARTDGVICLQSIDRGLKFETPLENIHELKNEPRLELLSKLVYFFQLPHSNQCCSVHRASSAFLLPALPASNEKTDRCGPL